MHFVYKLNNLFRSIRVSDENSSITKGFHFFTCNCSDILDESHHQNSCGEKVFTFSSRVSLAYCAVTMDNLHRLTGCLGQP